MVHTAPGKENREVNFRNNQRQKIRDPKRPAKTFVSEKYAAREMSSGLLDIKRGL